MARTTFSGPVKSDNGFEGNVVGSEASFTVLRAASATFTNFTFTSSTVAELSATVFRSASATITNLIATSAAVTDLKSPLASATVLRSSSATVTNLLATSLTVGSTKFAVAVNAASGTVSAQTGYIQVLVGATTAYIALYKSVTV